MRHHLALLPFLLAACTGSATGPYDRPGAWRPVGANQANLRAMLANPGDLLRGAEAHGQDGHLAAAAIDRLRQDKTKPLPESALARIGPAGTAGGAP